MAIRIQLPPVKRPPVRLDPIIKAEIPAELLRRVHATAPVMPAAPSPEPLSTVTRSPILAVPAGLALAGIGSGRSTPPFAAVAAAAAAAPVAETPAGVTDAAPVDAPASEAILQPSAAPALIRASSLIFRWGAKLAVLLLIGFLAMKSVVPFLNELRRPGGTTAIADKEAPTAVRLIQQTRQVVAKSDANVAYLNEVAAAADTTAAAPKAAPAAPAPVTAPVAPASESTAGALTGIDPSLFHEAVARLKVGGVFEGAEPRAYLDGRLVKYGEIINRPLGLRFIGVDPEHHAVLFTNAENVTFRKHF